MNSASLVRMRCFLYNKFIEMKSIKFLLGNNTLSLLAGSETWTYTLAMALKNMGHSVHCFSPELGYISRKLEDQGIRCFNNLASSGVKPFSIVLEEEADHNYDVIIANHHDIVKYLRAQYPRKPIISTIHGIIHEDPNDGSIAPEHPALDAGVQQFVVVSEEIQSLLQEKYNLDSIVIRNFLDTKHFKPKGNFMKFEKPKQILFNSNYNFKGDQESEILKVVAKHFGAKLAAIGMNFISVEDPIDVIKASDIVVAMGRSVLEGMAVGKPGIVFGRWGYGGIINNSSIDEIRFTNFSGRGASAHYEGKDIATVMIDQIESLIGTDIREWSRNYILRDHNADTAAQLYVNIALNLLGQPPKEADSRRPYRRARDVKSS